MEIHFGLRSCSNRVHDGNSGAKEQEKTGLHLPEAKGRFKTGMQELSRAGGASATARERDTKVKMRWGTK